MNHKDGKDRKEAEASACDYCQSSTCDHCESQNHKPLKRCGACRLAFYCSISCQKQAWVQHKSICARIKTLQRRSEILEQAERHLSEELRRKESQIKDQRNQIQAKNQQADDREQAMLLSRPHFQAQLERETWFFCEIGNCDSEVHECRWRLCDADYSLELETSLQSEVTLIEYQHTKYKVTKRNNIWIQTKVDTRMVRFLRQANRDLIPTSLEYWARCAKAYVHECLPFYAEVQQRIESCLPEEWRERVTQVTGIYSARQYLTFNCDYKFREFKKKSETKSDSQLIFAFHGFGDSKINSIAAEGFLLHYSQTGVFSRGIYVTTSPEVCDQHYVKTTKTGERKMLFCLVNLGCCHYYKESFDLRSDRPCEKNGQLLDSIGFMHNGARAFVVPNPSQIYPVGIITYK